MNGISPCNKTQQPRLRSYFTAFFAVLIFLYVSSLYFVHNYKHIFENQEYPMWEFNREIANSKTTEKQDLIVIGDSRIKAGFNPKDVEINAMNISIGGGTPIEGYYTLKAYLLNNPKPEKVLLSYAPFHLMSQDTFWERAIRFNYFNYAQYAEIKQHAQRLNDNVLGEYRRWKYYLLPSLYSTSLINGIYQSRWELNEVTYNEVKENKGHSYYGRKHGSSGHNHETKYKEFDPSKLMEYYLEQMINLAVSNSIPIYWYTAPFNKASCHHLSQKFRIGFNEYIRNLQKMGVSVIREISCWHNKLFGDASHVFLGSSNVTNDIIDATSTLENTSGRWGTH
jgi:hypothetical protein